MRRNPHSLPSGAGVDAIIDHHSREGGEKGKEKEKRERGQGEEVEGGGWERETGGWD